MLWIASSICIKKSKALPKYAANETTRVNTRTVIPISVFVYIVFLSFPSVLSTLADHAEDCKDYLQLFLGPDVLADCPAVQAFHGGSYADTAAQADSALAADTDSTVLSRWWFNATTVTGSRRFH